MARCRSPSTCATCAPSLGCHTRPSRLEAAAVAARRVPSCQHRHLPRVALAAANRTRSCSPCWPRAASTPCLGSWPSPLPRPRVQRWRMRWQCWTAPAAGHSTPALARLPPPPTQPAGRRASLRSTPADPFRLPSARSPCPASCCTSHSCCPQPWCGRRGRSQASASSASCTTATHRASTRCPAGRACPPPFHLRL